MSSHTITDSVRSFFDSFNVTEQAQNGIPDSNFLKENISNLQQSLSQSVFQNVDLEAAQVVLLAIGVIIFLGIAGESFFRRTGIPDVAFLMIFGAVLGPILGIVDTDSVVKIVPYFAALALIIIMFDGGLNLNIKYVIKTAHFALLLSVAGFAISVIFVTLIAVYGLGWQLLDSILLGSIVGGSSSIIVFGLVRRLAITDETKSMLSLESAITDILATIAAFLLFETVMSGHFDPNLVGVTAGKAVGVGLILGFGVGIPWMYVSTKIANAKHAYMFTLAMLFVLFFLAKSFGESGALTALIFGLMIGNKQLLSPYLKFKLPQVKTDDSFHEELTFLVRSFFFVFVGLLASFGQLEYLIFGVIMAVAIYIGRIGIVKASLTKRFPEFDKKVTAVMLPRGLAAAVLATLPLTLGLPNAEAYPQIVFVIIMSTVIITTLGLTRASKGQPKHIEPEKRDN
ncbi:MAG TPA: cation:proton antiporter [Nitrosopumilaceae archaeon]|nr:cation:proton antiporter [Nitrosopumilaceae archaeon]